MSLSRVKEQRCASDTTSGDFRGGGGVVEALEARQLLSAPLVQLTVAQGFISEGVQPLLVTIAAFCDHMNQSGFTVEYSVSPSDSTDFEVTGSAQVGDWTYPGWRYAQLELHAQQDNEVEQNEPVTITLLPDPNGTYAIGVPGVPPEYAPPDAGIKTVQIIDSPPKVSIEQKSDGSEDGTPMLFRLTRTGGDTSIPVDVTLALAGGSTASASDMQLSTVSVGSETYVQIPVVDDSDAEWTERAVLQVMPGPNNVPGTTHIASARIRDNDVAIASLPTMMVANNDDDNANGIIDMSETTASTSDDEIEQLALTIPTTHNENGLVRLTLNGPLAAYDASGARLVTQDGVITWILAAGQTPPQQVLIAATGGVTQIDGASVQLMVTDDGGPQTKTTTTTPVSFAISHTSPSHTGKATTDVLVGERVTASAQTVAPDGWAGEVTWNVTGTRYKSYQATLNSATLDPLPQAPTGNAVDFFWSDAANGQSQEKVTGSVTINGLSIPREIKFAVYEPTATLEFLSLSARMDMATLQNATYFALGVFSTSQDAAANRWQIAGMVYKGSVSMPQGFVDGSWYVTQLITTYKYFMGNDNSLWGVSTNGQCVLDTDVARSVADYSPGPPPSLNWLPGHAPADGDTYVSVDSPSQGLGNTVNTQFPIHGTSIPMIWTQRADSFEATLMFVAASPGSTPVPLKRVSFQWGGSAYWDSQAGSWTSASPENYAVPGQVTDATQFPIWSGINSTTPIPI